ncbi:conserved hypothetical protein [Pseudomonas chlororaphis]
MGHVRPLTAAHNAKARHRAGFFVLAENPPHLCLCGLHARMHFLRINKCIYALTVYASMHIIRSKPPDSGERHRSLVAKAKAAMNRPRRFRGLATDPGVQRKAP